MKTVNRIFLVVLAAAAMCFAQGASSGSTQQGQSTAVPAQSAEAKKQQPPAGAAPKAFEAPKRTTYKLPNGLTISLVPYGSVPRMTVRAVTRAGNGNEAANQVWLADLTGNMMKEGTTKRSSKEVDERASSLGGTITVTVGADQTFVNGDALSEFAPEMITLLAEVLQTPAFPETELERLKNDLQRQLSVQKTQPQQIALERFRSIMYPDHPYGRLFPTEEMIKSYRLDDVRNFYRQNFGAQRTHLYIAGRFDEAAVRNAITGAFGKWEKGSPAVNNPPKPHRGYQLALIDRPGAAQSTIYLGVPVVDPSHPDYIELNVTNRLLGGYFSSRMTTNLREQKGYTYSPFSQLSSRYRDNYWVQVADVTTAVTGPSLKEIFWEIGRLQKEAPGEKELRGVQDNMAGVFTIQNSNRNGILATLNFVDLHGLGDQYITSYIPQTMATTPQQVQQMAQKYLIVPDMTLVVAGDKSKISEQVAAYEKAPQSTEQAAK